MRINPVSFNYQNNYQNSSKQAKMLTVQPTFTGKHSGLKLFGGIFGTLATAGAIGGSIIMTGGLSIPFILGYGALGAASGAVIGHTIDKGVRENKDLDKMV